MPLLQAFCMAACDCALWMHSQQWSPQSARLLKAALFKWIEGKDGGECFCGFGFTYGGKVWSEKLFSSSQRQI